MKKRDYSLWTKITVIFASFYSIFGTIWLSLSLFFFSLVFDVMLEDYALFKSESYTEGKILKRYEWVGNKNRKKCDYTVDYQVNNRKYQSVITSTPSAEIKEVRAGIEIIELKYIASDPSIVDLAEDADSNFFGYIFVLLFPLIGAIFLFVGLKKGTKNLYVIECGEVALGKFLHSEATKTRINGNTVMKMYFSFTDKYGKEQTTIAETHLTNRLTDEELEILVYMPKEPKKSAFVDLLPKIVREKLEPEVLKLKPKI